MKRTLNGATAVKAGNRDLYFDCFKAQNPFYPIILQPYKTFFPNFEETIKRHSSFTKQIFLKMAARQRKPKPAFKLAKTEQEQGTEDLKKVKEQALKDLQESKEEEKEWYDQELDKNLKNQ
jgi:hypothetical protein